MNKSGTDILMVTHARAAYTARSLRTLLDSCAEDARVWVWQNGSDPATLEVVESLRDHPRFHRFHHSIENEYLRTPTNWLFSNAPGDLVALVNDDCVVTPGWIETIREAHEAEAALGVIACWHFREEDFLPELAAEKLMTIAGGRAIMINPWVQGSGIIAKRACIERLGMLPPRDRGFTRYCIRIAAAGWTNGWLLPLVPIDHMDDPRSRHTGLRSDADIRTHVPLSAQMRGIDTIEKWTAHLRNSARIIHESPVDPRLYLGLRKRMRRVMTRLKREQLMY